MGTAKDFLDLLFRDFPLGVILEEVLEVVAVPDDASWLVFHVLSIYEMYIHSQGGLH